MLPLDAVPSPSAKRHAVRVTNDALRQIRGGHPWVFDGSVVAINDHGEGKPGDVAVVFDADRQFAAIGLYDPSSPIRIRILHQGKPLTIDEAWWTAKIRAATERREPVLRAGDTTGYRVIHGENDGLSGLVLDRYAGTFVLKLYAASWLPHLATIVPIIERELQPERLIVRFSRDVAGQPLFGLREGVALIGDAPTEPVMFNEHGLMFEADVIHGQKTGHFLDQRDNRNKVRPLAKGLNVLDLFSCTGGFSVYAAAGGATSVHSVDLSAQALETAKRNMAHNAFIKNVAAAKHTTQVGDVFDVLKSYVEQKRRYDMVIVDPPSFARRNSDHDRALHAYRRLTRLALELVDNDGILVQSSCSSRVRNDEFFDGIHAAAASTPIRVSEMLRTTHGADHPIGFPEGAYLKTMFARIAR
ncbi:MAG: class I SAM-dependent rRNA methyltransferase [Ilumatobacteraceae bacterium]